MLHPDIQAEIILSFQEEKRQRYLAMKERDDAKHGSTISVSDRALQFGGVLLIRAGRRLQRWAGVPEVRVVGEAV